MSTPPRPNLRHLPFAQQVGAIDEALAAGAEAELVAELARFRDHQPLAHAVAMLARNGALEGALAAAVAEEVLRLPDAGLGRVLRALEELPGLPAGLVAAVAERVGALPVSRIAGVSLVDRWLKNAVPELRAAAVEAALARCRAGIAAGRPDEVDDVTLLRVPGAAYADLDRLAEGEGIEAGWRGRMQRFAAVVLDALESQPKSLSQANAEQLLSRQVYTDPGHFLVELLQNADDAGARRWMVRVERDQVIVEHDGVPFDARDVVGVLSIGQTTKGREQIGFFGVGFKSVYEICERPQVYSGPFAFEIADVSIPRPLERARAADGRTVLVLPLRHPDDAMRGPARLYERVAALPGEVLLTLNSLRQLEAGYEAGERGQARRRSVRVVEEGAGRVRLVEDGGDARTYLVERAIVRYPGTRSAHRAESSPVLVAIALDEGGRPTPAPEGPTIYSYLPTGERSGLRVLVHAHFDLPVDRERLDLSSEWNRWALAQAGPLLAAAVRRLVAEQDSGERLDAVLSVLPLASELGDPAYGGVVEGLISGLVSVALLPGAAGERLAPEAALTVDDPRLARVLAGIELVDHRRPLQVLPDRQAAVARSLGARALTGSDVVEVLVADARARGEGAIYDAPWGAAGLVELAQALTTDPALDLGPLGQAPCLPDHRGRARRPDALVRAGGALRMLLAPLRPLLAQALEDAAAAAFLDRLRVGVARTRDLVAALAEPAAAAAVVAAAGAGAILDHLAEAAPAELAQVGAARVVPTSDGGLAAIDEVWLAGEGPIAAFVRGASLPLPLVDAAFEARSGAALQRLGARRLELGALVDLIAAGALVVGAGDVGRLHRAFAAAAGDLGPSLIARLVRASIYPDEQDRLRPLVGGDPALVPGDDQVRALWPGAPWLRGDVAELDYIARLGARAIGADAIAADLAGGGGRLDPTDGERRRAAFAYLGAHAQRLSTERAAALAAAPVWPDRRGHLRHLTALRRPSRVPAVAALDEIWPRAATIEPGEESGSALALAGALGLGDRIIEPDFGTAIDDLRAATGAEPGALVAPSLQLEDRPELDAAIARVLCEAAGDLPRSRLEGALDARVFAGADGGRRPLARWSAPSRQRCHRPAAGLVPALAHAPYPLLSGEAAARLAPFLDAVGAAPASVLDLVAAIGGIGDLSPGAAAAVRAALVAGRPELAALPEAGRAALAALPLWPTTGGATVAASAVLRPAALEPVLPAGAAGWLEHLAACGPVAVLDGGAEVDAGRLAAVIRFADPVASVTAAAAAVAVDGAPLTDQPALLAAVEPVAELAAALAARGQNSGSTPLAVTAGERLVTGRLLAASDQERAVAVGLPLHDQLGHPTWVAAVEAAAPGALERVSTRQVVAALQACSPEPMPPAQHASLTTPERRGALYVWLEACAGDIAADEQARGAFGRAAVILSAGGVLRAPRDLLLDPELPDLGIDWNAADEVPEALVAWLRATYLPGNRQLTPLVEHLRRAADQAATAGDGERVAALLEHLGRSLRATDPAQLAASVRRFKLRRHLRVETERGEFARPRRLLALDARDEDLLERFAASPPARVSSRYARLDRALALIRAAGADAELDDAALEPLLDGDGVRPGADAAVALACYVAGAASRRPELRATLRLGERTWVPDRAGTGRAAAELYWPDDDVAAIVGDTRRLFPHHELVHRVPELRSWLPLRKLEAASLEDVAAHATALVEGGRAVPDAIWRWLDDGLGAGRLRGEQVRSALGALPFLRDDAGRPRRPDQVTREGARALFGRRRGDWADGFRLLRLAEALRIPRRPGKREVLGFVDEIAGQVARGDDLVALDREAADRLPRCLDMLVEAGGRGPDRLPLLCQGADGPVVVLVPGTAAIASPGAPEVEDGVLAPVLWDGADVLAWRAYLERYGIRGDADAASEQDSYGIPPGEPEREVGSGMDRIAAAAPGVAGSEPAAHAEAAGTRASARTKQHGPDRGAASSPDRPVAPADGDGTGKGVIGRIRSWLAPERDAADDAADARRRARQRADEGDAGEPERQHNPRGGERDRAIQPQAPGSGRGRSGGPSRPAGGGGGARSAPDAADELAGEVDQRQWFRDDRQLGSQLRAAAAWLADRRHAADFGLAHAPRSLPLPYLYAPLAIFAAFDPRRQSWRRFEGEAAWREAIRPAGRAHLRGRLPGGEAVVPVPLYGRVLEATANPPARVVQVPGGGVVILADGDSNLSVQLALGEAPDFAAARPAAAPPALLAAAVADDELPDEVHARVAELRADHRGGLERVTAVRDFVRERYAYDPSYLEDPAIAAWLRQRSRGRSNEHLAALHAGGDAEHLGRGVCYELNILTCELLRRSGVPAAIATGWTFDRGFVDEPDHLWAMALLDAGDGPRWLPVDAAATRAGRPLHAGRRPPGPWRASERQARAVRAPDWVAREPKHAAAAAAIPTGEMLRVARYLETLTGTHLGNRDELLRACRELLRDPGRAAQLAALLRDGPDRDE